MSIAFVQSRSITGTGTLSLAFSSPNTAGNFLVIGVGAVTSGQTFAVTDSHNTYSSLPSFLNASGGLELQIFFVGGIAGGANTVQFNPGGSFNGFLALAEFSGINTKDVSASANGAGQSADSGGAATNFANELLFGLVGAIDTNNLGISSVTPGTNWTGMETAVDAGTSPSFLTEYQIVSSAGTYDATATIGRVSKSTVASWGAEIVTFWQNAGPTPKTKSSAWTFGF